MKMLVQKSGTVAIAFRKIAVAASISLIALTSQLSHAATATTIDSKLGGSEYDGIDRDLIADAELTELSVGINFSPYVFRGKNTRHKRKRYSNVQRNFYGHRYSNSSRYRSYRGNSRLIIKGHRRGSGVRFGNSRRRH